MIASACLCKKKGKSLFKEIIRYQNETCFKAFNGLIIARCINCGLLKTINIPYHKPHTEPINTTHHYEANQNNIAISFRPIVAEIKKFKTSGNVLDVGCSTGILLTLLKKEGFKVYGVEPNKKAFLCAKKKLGPNISFGVLNDFIKTDKRQYDVVIYNHTLEHIKDIHEELALVKKIMKNDGLIIMGVPNTANVIFYLRQKHWESLLPDQHVWHFNSNYIKRLLETYGFRILNTSFTDHTRLDYPFLKKIYFSFLCVVNKILRTGEAVLFVAQKNKPI